MKVYYVCLEICLECCLQRVISYVLQKAAETAVYDNEELSMNHDAAQMILILIEGK